VDVVDAFPFASPDVKNSAKLCPAIVISQVRQSLPFVINTVIAQNSTPGPPPNEVPLVWGLFSLGAAAMNICSNFARLPTICISYLLLFEIIVG
jgi:hypothetical protein